MAARRLALESKGDYKGTDVPDWRTVDVSADIFPRQQQQQQFEDEDEDAAIARQVQLDRDEAYARQMQRDEEQQQRQPQQERKRGVSNVASVMKELERLPAADFKASVLDRLKDLTGKTIVNAMRGPLGNRLGTEAGFKLINEKQVLARMPEFDRLVQRLLASSRLSLATIMDARGLVPAQIYSHGLQLVVPDEEKRRFQLKGRRAIESIIKAVDGKGFDWDPNTYVTGGYEIKDLFKQVLADLDEKGQGDADAQEKRAAFLRETTPVQLAKLTTMVDVYPDFARALAHLFGAYFDNRGQPALYTIMRAFAGNMDTLEANFKFLTAMSECWVRIHQAIHEGGQPSVKIPGDTMYNAFKSTLLELFDLSGRSTKEYQLGETIREWVPEDIRSGTPLFKTLETAFESRVSVTGLSSADLVALEKDYTAARILRFAARPMYDPSVGVRSNLRRLLNHDILELTSKRRLERVLKSLVAYMERPLPRREQKRHGGGKGAAAASPSSSREQSPTGSPRRPASPPGGDGGDDEGVAGKVVAKVRLSDRLRKRV